MADLWTMHNPQIICLEKEACHRCPSPCPLPLGGWGASCSTTATWGRGRKRRNGGWGAFAPDILLLTADPWMAHCLWISCLEQNAWRRWLSLSPFSLGGWNASNRHPSHTGEGERETGCRAWHACCSQRAYPQALLGHSISCLELEASLKLVPHNLGEGRQTGGPTWGRPPTPDSWFTDECSPLISCCGRELFKS